MPLLWPEAAEELWGEREELLLKCVMCRLRAFVCIKCCSDVPEEEAKPHPTNTLEEEGEDSRFKKKMF